jgi:hypothetical protein
MYSCYDLVFVLNGLNIHVQTALIGIACWMERSLHVLLGAGC